MLRSPIRRLAVAGAVLIATTLTAAVSAAADTGTFSGKDSINQTSWSIDWSTTAGTSQSCSADTLGNGWNCTTADPNHIDYKALAQDNTGAGTFDQVTISLYQGSGPTLVDSVTVNSCSSYNVCPAPSGFGYRGFATYAGGSVYFDLSYYWHNAGQAAFTNHQDTGLLFAFNLDTIFSNAPHPPPSVTAVFPGAGSSVPNTSPAQDAVVFVVQGSSQEGNNWTGQMKLFAANSGTSGTPIFTDNFLGATYPSGVSASSLPFILPTASGTYCWQVEVTDTSGLPAAQSVSGWRTFCFLH